MLVSLRCGPVHDRWNSIARVHRSSPPNAFGEAEARAGYRAATSDEMMSARERAAGRISARVKAAATGVGIAVNAGIVAAAATSRLPGAWRVRTRARSSSCSPIPHHVRVGLIDTKLPTGRPVLAGSSLGDFGRGGFPARL